MHFGGLFLPRRRENELYVRITRGDGLKNKRLFSSGAERTLIRNEIVFYNADPIRIIFNIPKIAGRTVSFYLYIEKITKAGYNIVLIKRMNGRMLH